MNVLDENIISGQCVLLREWRIHFRQIGAGVGRSGMDDRSEIIPLLRTLPRPTFFMRDAGFHDRSLCHTAYCLVVLDVPKDQAADQIRRLLRHPEFQTQAHRMGRVLRVGPSGIVFWERGTDAERTILWVPGR